jgi:hypothetical protein
MATPVFCCGFECGVYHWTRTGSVNYSTVTVRSGARAMRINPTAGATECWMDQLTPLNGTGCTVRVYVNFATLPNQDIDIVAQTCVSGPYGSTRFKTSDSKLYASVLISGTAARTNSVTGFSVTTGQWYRVDFKYTVSGANAVVTTSIDGTELDTVTVAHGGSFNLHAPLLGFSNSVTYTADYYLDDYILTTDAADYPIGPGYVNHFVPTSDGTHTAAGTTTVKGTIAAPTAGGAITSATTDAFNWVNGVPLLGGATDNTRLINAQTAASTTYAEVKFGPAPGISTPTTAPRAVEVVTADREASTATADFTVKLNDNGTENSVVARGVVAGVTTDRYARKHYATAPTGGAWTVAAGAGNFNNIRARFGYSSDATPDQYWRGIMIEAEFVQAVSFIPSKPLIYSQAVNRAANF